MSSLIILNGVLAMTLRLYIKLSWLSKTISVELKKLSLLKMELRPQLLMKIRIYTLNN